VQPHSLARLHVGPTAVKQIKTAGDIEVGCSSLKYVALQTRAICYQSGADNVMVYPYHPIHMDDFLPLPVTAISGCQDK